MTQRKYNTIIYKTFGNLKNKKTISNNHKTQQLLLWTFPDFVILSKTRYPYKIYAGIKKLLVKEFSNIYNSNDVFVFYIIHRTNSNVKVNYRRQEACSSIFRKHWRSKSLNFCRRDKIIEVISFYLLSLKKYLIANIYF